MFEIQESVVIQRDIETVFQYVSDLSHMAQWDPGVRVSKKISTGPIGPGSEFELTCAFFGFPYKMRYRLETFDAPNRVRFTGSGDSFSATDTISFHSVDQGTRIIYTLQLSFHDPNQWFLTCLGPAVRWIGKRAIKGLEDAFRPDAPLPDQGLLDRWMDRAILPGMLTFSKFGYRWRKKSWHPFTDSLKGKTVLVTGATSGIGKQTAMRCARMKARTIVVGRNPRKVGKTCKEIFDETGNPEVSGKVADLAIISEVRDLAEDLNRAGQPIHVLINNAGALFGERDETADGIERALAINLLAPFVLTTLLLPTLKASAQSRIVNVSSGGMYTARLPIEDPGFKNTPYDGPKAYARAKRGLVVLTEIWAERFLPYGITVHAMHPGWVMTPGISDALPRFTGLIRPFLRTPGQGADTVVWLAAAREITGFSGGFWLDRRRHTTHVFSKTRDSVDDRKKLILLLETLSGVRMSE